MSENSWITALILRKLTGDARLPRRDEAALIVVLSELHRIRASVVQMSRTISAAALEGNLVGPDLTHLADLRTAIDAHIRAVRQAFAGNLSYFDTPDE